MFDYSALQSLLDGLEQGNKFHICVVFFTRQTSRKLMVPHRTAIHATPVCNAAKALPNGRAKCMRWRDHVFRKARQLGRPFSGCCFNGVYEYCHPVYLEDKLYCMISIGNLLRDPNRLCKHLKPDGPLLDTMETGLDDAACRKLAQVVESYIRMLREQSPGEPRAEQNHAVISAVRASLDKDFDQPLTLSSMAQMYHYNEKYLGRIFKAQLGVSFGEYLNGKRLSHAAKLLRKTGDSILDISQRTGFNNVTYFNRLFRKKFGTSPSQYRKKRG